MNNIDRFLRIIYTEADLAQLLTLKSDILDCGSLSSDDALAVLDTFWIGSPNKTTSFATTVVGRYLRCYPKNYSKEETELLLDRQIANVARRSDDCAVNAVEFIGHAAKSLLTLKDSQLTIRPGYLMEWNGIANRIDQNVLFAAYDVYCGDGLNEGHVTVDYGDRRLKSILTKGVAENHAHLKGSGYSPEINWYCLLHMGEYRRGELSKALASLVGVRWLHPNVDESATVLALMKVPFLRKLLTAYATLDELFRDANASEEGEGWGGLTRQDVNNLIARLLLATDEIDLDLLARDEKFQLASSISAEEFAQPLLDSPAAYFFTEQDFLRAMFRMLKQKPLAEASPLVLYGLNTYIAAITQFKTWLLHDNLLMGFSRFSASEKDKELLIDYIPGGQRMLYRSVFDRYYRNSGVECVELRIPPKKLKDYVSLIEELDDANEKAFRDPALKKHPEKKIKYSVAVHFIKDGNPPNLEANIARKDETILRAEAGMRRLEMIFAMDGDAQRYPGRISAIDTANFERNTRPEIFGPVFRKFRRAIACSFNVGLTYHAGEDFPTLCNGLRAIDDAIRFLDMTEGDRLGHATALGLDVAQYFEMKRGYITSSLQDYVDDIVWMWKLLFEAEGPNPAGILAFLSYEYGQWATKLFANAHNTSGLLCVPAIEEYAASYELRGNDPYLYRGSELEPLGPFENHRQRDSSASVKRADENPSARELYSRYNFETAFKQTGMQSIVIPATDDYIKAVELSQAALREKVHRLGLSIETNPTSNRKISFVDHYIDLPFIRLNRHGLHDGGSEPKNQGPDIALTINTDDSGVFQTDLAMEYALVVEALKLAGYNHEDIYAYIDYLREFSLAQFVKLSDDMREFNEGDDQL